MIVKSYKDVVPYRVQEGDAKGAYIRPLISEEDGAGNYHLFLLRLEPGGCTPSNQYDYTHQMFVRKGDGEIIHSSNARELKEGDVVLVHEEENYQIRNDTDVDLEILVVLPAQAEDFAKNPEQDQENEETHAGEQN